MAAEVQIPGDAVGHGEMHIPPTLRDVAGRLPDTVRHWVSSPYFNIAKLTEVTIDGEQLAAGRQDVLEDSCFPVASVTPFTNVQAGSRANQLDCLSSADVRP